MKNADKVRNMTNEELADFMVRACAGAILDYQEHNNERCYESFWEEWLQKED